ncbi:hypothetical protein ACW5EG_12765 [Luteimonas sp. A611]
MKLDDCPMLGRDPAKHIRPSAGGFDGQQDQAYAARLAADQACLESMQFCKPQLFKYRAAQDVAAGGHPPNLHCRLRLVQVSWCGFESGVDLEDKITGAHQRADHFDPRVVESIHGFIFT